MESLEQLEQNLLQLLNQYQELQLQVQSLQEENQRQRDEIIQAHAESPSHRQGKTQRPSPYKIRPYADYKAKSKTGY